MNKVSFRVCKIGCTTSVTHGHFIGGPSILLAMKMRDKASAKMILTLCIRQSKIEASQQERINQEIDESELPEKSEEITILAKSESVQPVIIDARH